MSTARIRPADATTGALGAALLVTVFLDWYSLPQGAVNGWGAFGILDLLLALVALIAIAVPVVTATNGTPAWPVANLVVTTALAFLTGLFLLYRLFDQPGPDSAVATAAGVWLGSFALLALLASAAIALRDERSPGVAGPGEIPVVPAPPREVAGSSPTESPA